MTSVTQRLALLSGKYNMRNPAETSASVRRHRHHNRLHAGPAFFFIYYYYFIRIV